MAPFICYLYGVYVPGYVRRSAERRSLQRGATATRSSLIVPGFPGCNDDLALPGWASLPPAFPDPHHALWHRLALHQVEMYVCTTLSVWSSCWLGLFTDRVSREGKPIGSGRLSVRLSVCFHSIFWTDWALNFILCMCVGHDHSSPGIESLVKVMGQN